MMKVRDKNPVAKALIEELIRMGVKSPAWRAVAEGLNRPARQSYEVNMERLERFAAKGESIVVPGPVLGIGSITKPLTVAAVRFSGQARQKIEKAGGKCMDIAEMAKADPAGKKIRIMG